MREAHILYVEYRGNRRYYSINYDTLTCSSATWTTCASVKTTCPPNPPRKTEAAGLLS